MPQLLARAVQIAFQAHANTCDRYGAPYILHPLRVMAKMTSDQARIVAILHDVVEDTAWTLGALRREGFPEPLLRAVDAVTRRDAEGYEAFVRRTSRNRLAVQVKLGDLEDNMDLRRLDQLQASDLPRFNKYMRAYRKLKQAQDRVTNPRRSKAPRPARTQR